MNCPSCGAKINPGDSKCEYCGTSIEARQASGENVPPQETSLVKQIAFKRVSILVMILLYIVTLGFYSAIWYILRRNEFKEIAKGVNKINGLIIAYTVVTVLNFFLILDSAAYYAPELGIISWACFGLGAYLTYVIRGAIRKHVSDSGNGQMLPYVLPSALWAIIFQQLYLQIHINKLIKSRVFYER